MVVLHRPRRHLGRHRQLYLLARAGLPDLRANADDGSTAVDEEVLDAVAELTNMIIGSVKTDLEQHLGPLGLSIPTVVFGRNFKTRSAGNTEWIVVRFHWDDECLLVKMCLAPNERAGHTQPHIMRLMPAPSDV